MSNSDVPGLSFTDFGETFVTVSYTVHEEPETVGMPGFPASGAFVFHLKPAFAMGNSECVERYMEELQ